MRVAEFFAGVGGFRVGLEAAGDFSVVYSNQWEPSSRIQPAHFIYEKNFGVGSCDNRDIHTVKGEDVPNHDLLVAGFPCQDYSVATSLKHSKGLKGKKGVLWWELYRIIQEKSPEWLLLENVNRLLISPSKQRGRDFAIILVCLMQAGYSVEWKVVNPGNYGMPQRRLRVFILAHKGESTDILSRAFPFEGKESLIFAIPLELEKVSQSFSAQFFDYGVASRGMVHTEKVLDRVEPVCGLGSVLVPFNEVDKSFHIGTAEEAVWKKKKGGMAEERVTDKGFSYVYRQGKMAFPDSLDKPSRTIVTEEGGARPSRFKHVVLQEGVLRRLVPVELERLNMFPDNHTEGVSDVKRAFLMGNALVTGVVTRIGELLLECDKDG